jgi:hypothetical protein
MKGKSIPKFELDSVYRRIDAIGHDQYAVDLSPHILNTAVPREFFSQLFGGNKRQIFPPIAKKHVMRHGYHHFMFARTEYNPYLPLVPGFPGLKFFCTNDAPPKWRSRVLKTIIRQLDGTWLYVGEYAFTPAPSLTTEEWSSQQPLVSRGLPMSYPMSC